MIKAIIFDIDGVLLDSFEANHKFFSDLMIKFGYKAPSKKTYTEAFHLTMFNTIKKLTNFQDDKKIQKIWEAGKNGIVPYPDNLLKAPDQARNVIKTLSNKYELGIVTSRIKESVEEATKLKPLLKYFSTVITVYDTDKHKPSPEPLLLCAQRMKIDPEECVYIGDVKNDVLAAKAANMKMIVYGKNNIKDVDKQTNSFDELPSIIQSLN